MGANADPAPGTTTRVPAGQVARSTIVGVHGFPQVKAVKGAWIAGHVDLDNVTTSVDIWLFNCVLSDGLTAWNAQLPSLGLEGCWVQGEVNLAGAHLGLLARGAATLRNNTGPALYANGIRVEHGLVLSGGFDAEGAGQAGAVHLSGAHVGGWVNCSRAHIRNATGPALTANQLRAGALRLDNGFEAAGAGNNVVLDLAAPRSEPWSSSPPAWLSRR